MAGNFKGIDRLEKCHILSQIASIPNLVGISDPNVSESATGLLQPFEKYFTS